MSTITVLHPGQMGAAIAAQAVAAGHQVLWLPEGRSESSRRRAAEAGLLPADDLATALEQSEIVISVCPPAAAEEVAAEVAAVPSYTGLYVDANAISPTRAGSIAHILSEAGATFLDGSIIGPPPAASTTARLYLAGDPVAARRVAAIFDGTLVAARCLDRDAGAASALKLAFASYQKAARTLVGVAHALADQHGVTAELIDEGRAMAGPLLADRDYLRTVAPRAWRWAPEMRDVADTLVDSGLPADLAHAAAVVLTRWSSLKDRDDLTVEDVLDALRPTE
ncbi:DUF1932 domain-containing protein [Kitasatospora sp. NPDC056273]|uniref:NAD(P)-dependent oxidoreductase n=1 Tax=Kitasatospora sp. NPDC056273 TaxID=3345769 RepID=UPI0035D8D6E3